MKKSLMSLFIIGFCLFNMKSYVSGDSQFKGEKKKDKIISLLGRRLVAPDVSQKVQKEYEKAKTDFKKDPNEDNVIWYGRRAAYLYNYKEAINIYSNGIRLFPRSYRLYRHRGHRYISIRQFDKAIADLENAVALIKGEPLKVEPDGMPNKLNIPLSNSQFNIWYHLGLAFYLKGKYEKAISAYDECLKWSNNDDLLVATLDWLYMSLRRIGEKEKAEDFLKMVNENMKIIESQAYYSRLLMYKGLLSPESLLKPAKSSKDDERLNLITQGYGVGNWYFYHGRKTEARKIFESVVQGNLWSAFGFIAAEVDLARHFAQK